MAMMDTCYYTKRLYLARRMTYLHACARAMVAGRAEVGINPLAKYLNPPRRHAITAIRRTPTPPTSIYAALALPKARRHIVLPAGDTPTLGELLRAHGLSPERFAAAYGLSETTVYRITVNQNVPRLDIRLRIAQALGMSVAAIRWPEWREVETPGGAA